jgi:AmmeMemoRadiSam system protein A
MPYAFVLDEHEKRELLRIARATLKEFLVTGRSPPGAPHRKSLLEPAGVFVTLHRHGSLRGCIGTVVESSPLYKAVQEMAIAAASRDPRFDPVTVDEVATVTIEISVLGARRQVQGPHEIRVGAEGIAIHAHGRRGLLLPQVAAEHAWDAETFLEKVCEKAGIPRDAWRHAEALVEAFEAQVFDEASIPPMMPLRTGSGG